jgi:hypothetical protein
MANARTPEIIARVRARANSLSSQAVSDDVILDLLDEAQIDLCLQLNDAALGPMQHVQTAALTLDEVGYALPTRFLRETVLTYHTGASDAVAAIRWQVHRLYDLVGNPNLKPSEAKPFYYFWDNLLYIRAGTKTAGNYALYYIRTPAALTTATDPELSVEYDGLLETFAVARCWEGRAEYAEAETLWAEYLGRCQVINSRHGSGLPFDGVAGDRR